MDAEKTFIHLFQSRLHKIDDFLAQYFDAIDLPEQNSLHHFRASMKYSIGSGGKRFRPLLALLVGEIFDTPEDRIMPWAVKI